ncbi:MAG: prephenate dehydratase [Pseudomonadota bacterium]|nr:prephenate dehydratase [Pseudomonadota bacterium]
MTAVRTIAFQGEPGAFSHAACLSFVPDAEPRACPSFEAAVEAVRSGACALALLPVSNSIAGPVEPVVRLLAETGLRELGRHDLVVRMALIGAPGAGLSDLRTVASHPVALRQCNRLIADLGLSPEPAFDTAGAARLLAENPDRSRGVLASEAAAALHGLPVLRADVEDQPGASITTFLALAP